MGATLLAYAHSRVALVVRLERIVVDACRALAAVSGIASEAISRGAADLISSARAGCALIGLAAGAPEGNFGFAVVLLEEIGQVEICCTGGALACRGAGDTVWGETAHVVATHAGLTLGIAAAAESTLELTNASAGVQVKIVAGYACRTLS
jgi:hypothetical protein